MTDQDMPLAFCEECFKLTGNKIEVPILHFEAMRDHLQQLHCERPDIEINVTPKGEIGFQWGQGL